VSTNLALHFESTSPTLAGGARCLPHSCIQTCRADASAQGWTLLGPRAAAALYKGKAARRVGLVEDAAGRLAIAVEVRHARELGLPSEG
jgi:hypothetical protein